MVFSSVTFLFWFLPAFLLLYALLPARNAVILLASLVFYAWGEGVFVALLIGSVLVNYGFGTWIAKRPDQRLPLALGVGFNLAGLIYFKYFGFLAQDVFGFAAADWSQIHLPLGISFFTFQSISYLVDLRRGDAKPANSLPNLALYIAMFPQLIAGPIVRYASVAEAINQRVITLANVQRGVLLFVLGLGQKVLLANNVAVVADGVFELSLAQLTPAVAWAGALAYTLQIFFDFAGYSLMAIGLGLIMGFQFPQNFNYPYISTSITEFWRRWHMSLSSWFRDYLYIPLGGNRKGPIRTYFNLFIVFVLCGLWHGAAWTFLIWGIYHGLLLVVERIGLSRLLAKAPALIAWGYTLLAVIIGWVFFRAESLPQALEFLTTMIGLYAADHSQWQQVVTNEALAFAAIGFVFCAPVGPWLEARWNNVVLPEKIRQSLATSIAAVLFLACTVYVMAGTYNPFIYFRF